MKSLLPVLSFIVLTLLPFSSFAGSLEDTPSQLCATIDIMECDLGGICQNVQPDSVDLPRFFEIDFQNLLITGVRQDSQGKSTPIERMEEINRRIIMQGAEQGGSEQSNGVGWNISLNTDTGRAVLTASGDDVGFVVFCECTNLK